MLITEISRDPRINRDPSNVYRWRDAGGWEEEKENQAVFLAKKNQQELDKLPAGLRKIAEEKNIESVQDVMGALDIDWDPTQPLSPEDFTRAITAIVKGLMQSALKDIITGKVKYRDPYQIHGLLELLFKESHLAKGEPTEIKRVESAGILPEDDVAALNEAMHRLKQIAQRRKDEKILPAVESDD